MHLADKCVRAALQFFGKKRLRQVVLANATVNCGALHDAVLEAVTGFIASASQADDITLVVIEYSP